MINVPASCLVTETAPVKMGEAEEIVSWLDVGPLKMMPSVSVGSGLDRLIVPPLIDGSIEIVSTPAEPLASITAWRNEPAPESLSFVTVKTAACRGEAASQLAANVAART